MRLGDEMDSAIQKWVMCKPSTDAEFVMQVLREVWELQISTGKRTFLHEFDHAWNLFRKDHNLS